VVIVQFKNICFRVIIVRSFFSFFLIPSVVLIELIILYTYREAVAFREGLIGHSVLSDFMCTLKLRYTRKGMIPALL
jgi:hypothetical protein